MVEFLLYFIFRDKGIALDTQLSWKIAVSKTSEKAMNFSFTLYRLRSVYSNVSDIDKISPPLFLLLQLSQPTFARTYTYENNTHCISLCIHSCSVKKNSLSVPRILIIGRDEVAFIPIKEDEQNRTYSDWLATYIPSYGKLFISLSWNIPLYN